MEGLLVLAGVVLGWLLGVGTQLWRDRRQARIALTLVHNELLGNIAQLDLAHRTGIEEDGTLRPSHWYKRWRLSRTAWEQHGAVALSGLGEDGIWALQEAYHALDAAELLLEEAREGVIAVREVDLSAPENAALAARAASADADSRERLGIQLAALRKAHDAVDRKLGLADDAAGLNAQSDRSG
jgi:hypothetical protein